MDESHRLQACATSDLGDRPLRVISVASRASGARSRTSPWSSQPTSSAYRRLVIVDHRRDSLLLFQVPPAVIDSIHEVADEIRHLQP